MMSWQDPTHPTGVSETPRNNTMPSSKAPAARQRKADTALSLRLAGASWAEIAQVCGYPTPRAALVATERSLVKRLDDADRGQMRQLAGARLERLLRGIWAKATDTSDPDQLAAVARCREIIDRHARLFGLDAPTEIVVHNPTKTELETWVMQVVAAGAPEVEEEDIFDADVVENPSELTA
jgi:hypothetical protein